jgi:hypothetical protein
MRYRTPYASKTSNRSLKSELIRSSSGGEVEFHQLASRPEDGIAAEALPERLIESAIHVLDALADPKHLERWLSWNVAGLDGPGGVLVLELQSITHRVFSG